jgi:hypothetical protein
VKHLHNDGNGPNDGSLEDGTTSQVGAPADLLGLAGPFAGGWPFPAIAGADWRGAGSPVASGNARVAMSDPAATGGVSPPSGLIINVSYNSDVSGAPAGFKTDIDNVVKLFEGLFTNNATINITVDFSSLGGALGESLTNVDSNTYAGAKTALTANGQSTTQQNAYSTLPASSPDSGTLWVATAEEKALGLVDSRGTGSDGTISIDSHASFSYGTGAPPSGQYYFIGVFEHELSEIMGRASYLDANINSAASYSIMDLFRFASSGNYQTTDGGKSYFSIDKGKTDLGDFNNGNNGGDLGDWASTVPNDA